MNLQLLNLQLLKNQLQIAENAIQSLKIMIEELEEAQRENPEACQHPKESRLDMSAMGVEEWQCRDCGFIYREEVT